MSEPQTIGAWLKKYSQGYNNLSERAHEDLIAIGVAMAQEKSDLEHHNFNLDLDKRMALKQVAALTLEGERLKAEGNSCAELWTQAEQKAAVLTLEGNALREKIKALEQQLADRK